METVINPSGVLVVEDDDDLRAALVDLLHEHGYEAQGAEDGLAGMRVLRSGLHPGLILLDLRMPNLNGWMFRAEQLDDPDLADIPVAILSGGGEDETTTASLNPVGFVAKPVDRHSLEVLRNLLTRHCAPG